MTLKKRSVCVFFAVAVLVQLSGFDPSEARRRRRSRRAPRPKVVNEKKLIERIGGVVVLERAVQNWLETITSNAEMKRFIPSIASLEKDSAARLQIKKDLVSEFCELADGPCSAPNQGDGPWRSLKAKWELDEPRALALVSLIGDSFAGVEIQERERNELLGRLGDGDALSIADEVGPDSERRGGRR